MTEKERLLIIDLCALLEAYMSGRINWDGSTRGQATATIAEAEKLLYPTRKDKTDAIL